MMAERAARQRRSAFSLHHRRVCLDARAGKVVVIEQDVTVPLNSKPFTGSRRETSSSVSTSSVTMRTRCPVFGLTVGKFLARDAIQPMENGIVLHTLHEPRDLYDLRKLFDRVPRARPDAEMVKLATQLIERQQTDFEPADLEDRYEARPRAVIDAKLTGEGVAPEEPKMARADNVIDLMAALKRSLGQESQSSPSPPPGAEKRKTAPPRKAKPPARRATGPKRA
jgi:hypothetical protein